MTWAPCPHGVRTRGKKGRIGIWSDSPEPPNCSVSEHLAKPIRESHLPDLCASFATDAQQRLDCRRGSFS